MIDCNCATTPKTKDNPLGICGPCARRALRAHVRQRPGWFARLRQWIRLASSPKRG